MLLFIGQYTSPGYTKLYRFNTSHVTLYPYDDTYDVVIHWFQYISCYSLSQEDESYDETGIVSIHLMLLFIITPVAEDWDKRLFQYISCYSLSVYVLPLQSAPSFQYISCYSLSSMCITMHNIFLFQYISCYSLSECTASGPVPAKVSIHLMLLFIPRFIGFSSSNSFYNTAKYKGLQDFYQPIYHFLFTQQNLI